MRGLRCVSLTAMISILVVLLASGTLVLRMRCGIVKGDKEILACCMLKHSPRIVKQKVTITESGGKSRVVPLGR